MIPRSSSSRRSRPRRSSMPPPTSFPVSTQDALSEDQDGGLSFQNLFTHVDSPSKRPVISEVSRILAASSDVIFELPSSPSTRPPLSRSISLRSESALEPIAEEEALPLIVDRDPQLHVPRVDTTIALGRTGTSLVPRVGVGVLKLNNSGSSGSLLSVSKAYDTNTTMPVVSPLLPPSPAPSERSQLLLIRADMHWRRSAAIRALHDVRNNAVHAHTQWRRFIAARAWARLQALDRAVSVWVRRTEKGRRTLTNIAKLHRQRKAVIAWKGWIDARRRQAKRYNAATQHRLRGVIGMWRMFVGVRVEHRVEAVMAADMWREWRMRTAFHALREHTRKAMILHHREAQCRDLCAKARMHVALGVLRALAASRTLRHALETRHRRTLCERAFRQWRTALAATERARVHVSRLVCTAARVRLRVCMREWREAIELPLPSSCIKSPEFLRTQVIPTTSSTNLANTTLTTTTTNGLPITTISTTATSSNVTGFVGDTTTPSIHAEVVARGIPLLFARDRRAHRFWRVHALSRALRQLRCAVGSGIGCRATRAARWGRVRAVRSAVHVWRNYTGTRRRERRIRLLAAVRQWHGYVSNTISTRVCVANCQRTCAKLRLRETVRRWSFWAGRNAQLHSQTATGRELLAIRSWRRVVAHANMLRAARQHAVRTHTHAAVRVLLRWARKHVGLRLAASACIEIAHHYTQQRAWRVWRWLVLRRAALARLVAVAILWEQSRCARRALCAWRVALAARRLTLAREGTFRQRSPSSSHTRTTHTATRILEDLCGTEGGVQHEPLAVGGVYGSVCGYDTDVKPSLTHLDTSRALQPRYVAHSPTPLSMAAVASHIPQSRPRPRPRPFPRDLPSFRQNPQAFIPLPNATSEASPPFLPPDAYNAVAGYNSFSDLDSLNANIRVLPVSAQGYFAATQPLQTRETLEAQSGSLTAVPEDVCTRSRLSRRPQPRPLPPLPPLSSRSALAPQHAEEDL